MISKLFFKSMTNKLVKQKYVLLFLKYERNNKFSLLYKLLHILLRKLQVFFYVFCICFLNYIKYAYCKFVHFTLMQITF